VAGLDLGDGDAWLRDLYAARCGGGGAAASAGGVVLTATGGASSTPPCSTTATFQPSLEDAVSVSQVVTPLADDVVELLRQMPRIEGCDWIFPGMKNKPLSDMSLTAVLRRMKRDDITVHGFRSTFRDWCAESSASSFGREAAEHALAHSLPDKVEAAYRRGDQFERRILLMAAWTDFCATTSATTATVTPIRGAA
jgi:hypothetical protein